MKPIILKFHEAVIEQEEFTEDLIDTNLENLEKRVEEAIRVLWGSLTDQDPPDDREELLRQFEGEHRASVSWNTKHLPVDGESVLKIVKEAEEGQRTWTENQS